MTTTAPRRYPTVRVSGGPRERGRQYGEQARERVRISREGYEAAFGQSAGWTWAQAVEAAAVMEHPIAEAFPQYLEELHGIAEGAGLPFADILTINCRTEVIWAASARKASAQRASRECSSLAVLGSRTSSGSLLVGQTWDWLVLGFDTLVLLEVEQPEAPNFVSVVEAGLLAKSSLNSSGIAVTTNSLVTSHDRGDPGIPYHVVLRALADAETVTDAINVVQQHVRASAANYLIASSDDVAVDLEVGPGDYRTVNPVLPTDGVLVHTNHFLRHPQGQDEVSVYAMPDSLIRLGRVEPAVRAYPGKHDPESLHRILSDHADFPASVCCHPDPREGEVEQWATVMAVVMEPRQRRMWVSHGNPCESPLTALDAGELLNKVSRLAKHRPAG